MSAECGNVNDATMDSIREQYSVFDRIIKNVQYDGKAIKAEAWEMFQELRAARNELLANAADAYDAAGTRLSVTLAEIAEQRAKGWPDFHPEDFCHRCGGRNVPSWHVDSDRFNVAFGPPDQHPYNGIVCPGCFVVAHEQATGMRCTWKLEPATPFRHLEAPLNAAMVEEIFGDAPVPMSRKV